MECFPQVKYSSLHIFIMSDVQLFSILCRVLCSFFSVKAELLVVIFVVDSHCCTKHWHALYRFHCDFKLSCLLTYSVCQGNHIRNRQFNFPERSKRRCRVGFHYNLLVHTTLCILQIIIRRRCRFWHATQDCVAPYVDIILHRLYTHWLKYCICFYTLFFFVLVAIFCYMHYDRKILAYNMHNFDQKCMFVKGLCIIHV